mmetsp:Transcript_33631/g.52950  ORF Transcript_33631/g.52950 Transcript_33631/m.52950 type:complete len:217 (-) Transcript_33631:509-1159(-)
MNMGFIQTLLWQWSVLLSLKKAEKRRQHTVMRLLCVLLVSSLLNTTQAAGAAGGNETALLTSRADSASGRRVTNVLMVTTTVRMLHRVHGHTSHLGPLVSLHTVFVEGGTSLQQRLVSAATAGNDADHASAQGRQGLLSTGRQTDAGGSLVLVVGDDDGVITRALHELSSVTSILLQVAAHCTLGHLTEGKDVANGQSSCWGGRRVGQVKDKGFIE